MLQTLAGGLLAGSRASSLSTSSSSSAGAEIPTALTFRENARLDRQPFGDLRVYLEGQTGQLKGLTVGSLELKPGQSPHPPHTHPEEEIMLITEGRGEISLEGRVTPVGPGAIMYAGSNRVHGVVNTGPSRLTFYYFKWIGK
jgi:quercetin dioxygenase-like cupin family protein